MKSFFTVFMLVATLTGLAAQNPNNAYRLPVTPDMPEWAQKIYRDDLILNVFELDEAFETWEAAYEAQEKAERDQWVDQGEDPNFEENTWEEYYQRWRHAVDPYIQSDGSLDFTKGPVPPKDTKPSNADNPPASWSLFGPTITYWAKNDNAAQPIAPWHANVYAIDVAPSDANTLYYGTETGALGKTTDKGLNWTPIGTDNMAFRSGVGAIAIHPSDPNTVYVGNSTGVHKTTNGGTTWTQELTVAGYNTNDIKIKPDAPEEALAGGISLRRRTTGPVWTTLISRTTYDIDFKPGNPAIAYALIRNAAGDLCEFYKSTDGGATFSVRSTGWISALGDGGGRLTTTTADANRVYVVLLTSSGPRVLSSSDAGETWTVVASGGSIPLPMDNGQGYYDLSITASQTNANHIVVATTTAYKSTDGGVNYTVVGGYSGAFGIHPDIQEMKTVGGDSWIATDGGINLSTDFWTSTANFSSRTNGLTGTHFWGFDIGWNEDAVVGGRYHNGNTAWHENYPAGNYLRMGGGEQATGYINPGNSRMAYFSDLGGGKILPAAINQNYANFTVTKFPNEHYLSMEWSEQEWDPRYYYTYYIGNANILWKTTTNGANFTALFTYPDATAKVQHIEVGRTDPNVLYCTVQRSASGELWKSTDGGVNWTQCTNPTGPSASERRISNVALSGTDANVLWWCFRTGPNGNKIFKSTDGGASWTNLTTTALNGVSLSDMVHQLGTDGGIYLSGDYGAVYYRNNNSTGDWVTYNTGLPAHLNTEISRLKIQYKNNKLRMASVNGVWQTDLYESPATTLVQPMVDNPSPSCSRDTLQLESYSVTNGSATYQWSFTPAPQWISNANIRNPRVVLGTTAGAYAATLTVTDANGMTSRTITDFMNNLPIGNLCEADTIPGKSLSLDGSGDYAVSSVNLNLNSNTVSLTAWVKRNGAQVDFSGLVYARGGTTSAGLSITSANALRYTWNDTGNSYNFNTGFTIPDNTWTHIALVITPTSAKVYMNGVAATNTTAHAAEAFDTPLQLGYDNGSRYFKGQIDEVTVWNKSLTQNEIREQMHLTLLPSALPNLVSYYQFNEPSGIVNDKVASRHAALVGNAARVVSTGPFGKGTSARQSVMAAGAYSFGSTGLTLNFPSGTYPNGELCVSRINQSPDQLPNALPFGRAYWIVNNFGTNSSFTTLNSLLFEDYDNIPVAAVPTNFQMYKRSSFADGNTWGAAIDDGDVVVPGVHGSILFSSGNSVSSFSQFVISYAGPLPVELLAFNTYLKDKNTAQLNWTTATEHNNKGFEIEWMPGRDGKFSTVGFVAGKGGNAGHNAYTFDVKNLSAGVHYFRLKQIDNDGVFEYSPIKNVTVGQSFSVDLAPNPVQQDLTVHIFQEETAMISIGLVNALGQTTTLLPATETKKGNTEWHFDLSAFPAGVYYCVCTSDRGVEETIRVVKQ